MLFQFSAAPQDCRRVRGRHVANALILPSPASKFAREKRVRARLTATLAPLRRQIRMYPAALRRWLKWGRDPKMAKQKTSTMARNRNA